MIVTVFGILTPIRERIEKRLSLWFLSHLKAYFSKTRILKCKGTNIDEGCWQCDFVQVSRVCKKNHQLTSRQLEMRLIKICNTTNACDPIVLVSLKLKFINFEHPLNVCIGIFSILMSAN